MNSHGPIAAPPTGRITNGRILNGARAPQRRDPRSFHRRRPREPHERYAIPEHRMQRDLDYRWMSLGCRGEPNHTMHDDFASGWEPVRAEDFPELSGYGVPTSQRLIELGHVKEVKAEDPIIDRNCLMLVARPKILSDESREEDRLRATDQVDSHMRRLRSQSRQAIGDKTEISRRSIRQEGPPSDMIPDEADLEDVE